MIPEGRIVCNGRAAKLWLGECSKIIEKVRSSWGDGSNLLYTRICCMHYVKTTGKICWWEWLPLRRKFVIAMFVMQELLCPRDKWVCKVLLLDQAWLLRCRASQTVCLLHLLCKYRIVLAHILNGRKLHIQIGQEFPPETNSNSVNSLILEILWNKAEGYWNE